MAPTAPPIEGELWINSDPLTADHLRGRVVVLVFWTASCEASLRRLQQVDEVVRAASASETPDDGDSNPVIAIAVHSPRMTCDDDVDQLGQIVERHRVTMPVLHDPRYLTWTRYDPPGWPSTAVIDRRGRVTGIVAGCHDIGVIEEAVGDAMSRPAGRRDEDHEIIPLPSTGRLDPGAGIDDLTRQPLRHPEGLAVAANGSACPRIAIADTGNDRALVGTVDADHRFLRMDTVITGLNQPAGILFTGRTTLAVVERGRNAVVAVDIDTGVRSLTTDRLLRPVGLAGDIDGSIIVTDAGQDRIFRATINSDRSGHLVLPIAGSGRTGVLPGRADDAELAQPVAAVRTGAGVVFADAASNNLRLLTDRGDVVNITDSDLFDWGLLDGPAHRARLQRPTGLAALPDGSVLVADTGNNRLRRLHHRRLETIGLSGLNSPTAVTALSSERFLVADTGNDRLVVVDPIRHDAWSPTVDGLAHARTIPAGPIGVQVSSGSATAAT